MPGLIAVVNHPTADPFDRLVACLALTAWGEEGGYRAVVTAAWSAYPPWHGVVHVAAAPFGLVAARVGGSDTMAERKGTEPARVDALRALVGVADREDFGDQLGAAIFTGPPSALAADVVAVARSGRQRLAQRPWPPFDLPGPLGGIREPLVEVDEPEALELVTEIVRRDSSPHTLGYVAFLVATGTTAAAEELAAHIVAVGGPSVGERLAEARGRR